MKALYFFSFLLLFFISSFSAVSSATALPESLLQSITARNDIEIQLSKIVPQPKTEITARIISSTTALEALEIVWMANGQIISHGKGKVEISFTVGDIGEKTEIAAIVQPQSGDMIVAKTDVTPANVIIISEFNTYTPKLYKGRARYSAKSKMTITAAPQIAKENGSLYKNSELIYKWRRNGMSIQNGSGLGKSSITLTGPGYLESYLISVDVRNTNGEILASRATIIQTEEPKVLLYEQKPLGGISYYRAIQNESFISGEEFSLLAEPFFFDVENRSSTKLIYEWFAGNTAVPSQKKPAELSFRTEDLTKNKIKISGKIYNTENLMQSAKPSFKINIGQESSTTFAL